MFYGELPQCSVEIDELPQCSMESDELPPCTVERDEFINEAMNFSLISTSIQNVFHTHSECNVLIERELIEGYHSYAVICTRSVRYLFVFCLYVVMFGCNVC